MIYMIKETLMGIELLQDDTLCFVKDIKATSFINEWCVMNGSTYEGRRKACAMRLQIHQKVPILISERTKDMMFPTRKVTTMECLWLNARGIDTIKRNGKHTIIYFLNGEQVEVAVEYRAIKREITLCSQYLEILDSFSR
ncbi:MAG: competence protein ComK [Longicatena sp.]